MTHGLTAGLVELLAGILMNCDLKAQITIANHK
jgi:hypothetical protein